MGVGHLAAGLGLSSADRRTNAGWFVLCAFLADILLGVFVLAGLEEVHVSPGFGFRHYFEFTFPYSHGMLATLGWAILAGGITRVFASTKTALLIATAVLSHFILDWIVHVPELPLAGEDSRKLGLGMWDSPATAIVVEAAVVAAGLFLYARAARAARWPMVAYVAVLTPLMIGGQWLMTAAPPLRVLAWNWIAGSVFLSAIAYAIDRRRMRPHMLSVDPSR